MLALRTAIAIAVLVLVLDSTAAYAQAPSMRDVVEQQLEPAYLVLPVPISGLDPVWYEAQLTAHFFVHRSSWPFAFVLTPQVVVRLFREYSDPVKTPSYMPRLALYAWSSRARPGDAQVTYASLAIGHHSNGQAGPALLPGRRPNHDSGDFYTNYIELAIHSRAAERAWLESVRVALQVHPAPLQQDVLVGRYGSLFAQLDCTLLDGIASAGTLRASLGATLDDMTHFAPNPIARQLERFPIELTYTHAFPEIELAIFARYYVGRDYYNIWFDRLLHTLQLGISSRFPPLEP